MGFRDFLAEMKEKGKLEMVEPSEDIKEAYLKKSESNLISAKILLENERLEEATSLAYYSMYNALLSLLYKTGIKSENHMASIILLKHLFGIDNRMINFAKKERIDKQYYVDFSVTRDDVKEMIKIAESFNSALYQFIERMRMDDIKNCRERFKKLLEGSQ